MLNITFISDYVCPYCLVAREALRRALAATGIEAEITDVPYELTQEPKPRVDTWNDPVRRSHYQVLEAPCRELDLPMKLPPHIVPRPYTRLAYEGMLFACRFGKEEAWSDRMYRAYFLEEKDIGEITVLKDIGRELELDADELECALKEGCFTRQEQEMVRNTRTKYQFSGVPAIYINGEKIELQDYSLAEMTAILQGSLRNAEASGPHCGEDGCSF